MDNIKVLFMGRKKVSADCLSWLLDNNFEVVGVLTQEDESGLECRGIAEKNGISLFTFDGALESINNGSLKFDLGLSMLFWRKLREGFVTVPSLQTINFHPAPLPNYKGTAGYNLAILEGLSEWAMSAHYIDENIDTGRIIKLLKFPIDPINETVQSLELASQGKLFDLFVDIMSDIKKAPRILDTIPNVGGRYISRTEMEAMKEVKPGDDVDRKIRAFWFPPYKGAFIRIDGKEFTLINNSLLSRL